MNSRSKSWTKAAVNVCALIQLLYALNIILLVVAVFKVIIDPGSIDFSSGQPITVNTFGMDIFLNGMSIYAVDGVASVPGTVLYLVFGCVQAAMCFLAFDRVRRVLDFSSVQSPFRRENVEKLRQAGFLFLGTVALQLAFALVSLILAFGVMRFSMDLKLDNVIIGIIVLCVSELFAQSVHMQDDVDGLV